MSKLTHDDLCYAAVKYLRGPLKCRVVLREFNAGSCFSTADAIGWRFGKQSHLFECKVSRSDFLRDAKKFHRREEYCPGLYRYYMTPPGLLSLADLPERWGLLEFDGKSFTKIRDAEFQKARSAEQELAMLYSVMIRHPDDPQHARVYRKLGSPPIVTTNSLLTQFKPVTSTTWEKK